VSQFIVSNITFVSIVSQFIVFNITPFSQHAYIYNSLYIITWKSRTCLRKMKTKRICNRIHFKWNWAGTAYPSGAPEFTPVFSGLRVTRSLVLCVYFVDRCLSCPAFYTCWPLCLRCLSCPVLNNVNTVANMYRKQDKTNNVNTVANMYRKQDKTNNVNTVANMYSNI
jgi:hypothetical protein